MAQLRHDYEKFKTLNAEVLVMVPNGSFMVRQYLKRNNMPFPILSDKRSQVAVKYFQLKQFLAIGTPSVFVVDNKHQIVYAHYATSVMDEPDNLEPLKVLQKLKD